MYLNDIILDGITILSLHPDELRQIKDIADQFNLDFEDAYQYAIAEKNSLQLISFDADFDRTQRGRKEP